MLRRLFLSRFSTAAAMLGLGAGGAQAGQTGGERWAPAHHAQDDWLDQLPGRHRLFFDATTAAHVEDAINFASNFLEASRDAYRLDDKDAAIVICLRHHATSFAFTDAVWAKYGKPLSDRISFVDPATRQPPAVNVHARALSDLMRRGVHFAVCDMASHRYARMIAAAGDGDPEAIYKEFRANAIGNSHFVSAGIVAVNRAQERGYSLVAIG